MNCIKPFIFSAGGILLAAALIRFIIAMDPSQLLGLPEPALGIPIRSALLLVGGMELLVAYICLFGRQIGVQLGWLAWLATNNLVYRIGLVTMGYHPQGTCIGSLTDPLHLSRGTLGWVTGCLPIYLLLCSYAAVISLWLKGRRANAATHLKMSCPACGVHIRFDEKNLGHKIPCPQCQKTINLRKPGLLKMACYFCKEHIEFPTHAIGEKIPCPHCKMDITLKEPA